MAMMVCHTFKGDEVDTDVRGNRYYCSNCGEWHLPKEPWEPMQPDEYPKHCKQCHTTLTDVYTLYEMRNSGRFSEQRVQEIIDAPKERINVH